MAFIDGFKLSDIRSKFITLSGRLDLANDDGSDNGADYYIQMGQRYLEKKIHFSLAQANAYFTISSGDYKLSWPNETRNIQTVWIENTDGATELEKKTPTEIRELYPSVIAEIATGRPLYYAVADERTVTIGAKATQGEFINNDTFEEIISFPSKGIILAPPADQGYVIQIKGLFYNITLSKDNDKNIWTIEHPNLLLYAALRELEISYRNTEGRKDWEGAIQAEAIEIDKDALEEEIQGINQMEG